MKCNPWRWLYGLPLLGMWFWITFESERKPIEADLTVRSHSVLTAEGFDWAEVAFEGRDSVLRGRAPGANERGAAAQLVDDLWGVRVVKDETGLLEAVDRYVWSATYASNAVRLSGFVPSDKARAHILKAVSTRFPDAAVEDDLKLARPPVDVPRWLNGISFGLEQLAQLERGKIELDNMDLSVSGFAPTYAAYKDVRTRFSQNAPRGVTSTKEDVLPPSVSPYTWHAKRTTTQLVISGHVPSEKARTQLFEYVKARFPKLAIIDRMETAAGAVQGWSRATSVAVDQLARLDQGEARMVDRALKLTGRAPSQDVADSVTSIFTDDVPRGFVTTADLTFPKPKPPTISPFVTSVDVEATRVVLFGYVPNDAERAAVVAAVKGKFPDRKVIDNLKLGSGEPQSWRACILAGLVGTEQLGVGSVRLSDRNVVVSGETADEGIAETLDGNVRAAANRACASAVNVKLNLPPEPKLRWSAVNDGDGRIVLEGDVPSRNVQSSLVLAASTAFPKADIVDRMSVVPGYAKKWRGVALTGVALLSKLRKGRAVLSGQDLVVSGEAADTAIAAAVKGQLKSALVRGYNGRDEVTVRSGAMIWAEDEAKRKAAAEGVAAEAERVKAAADAKRREAERETAEREAHSKAAAAAKLQAEQEAKHREEDASRRKAEAQDAARLKAEKEARERADAEARREADAAARSKKGEQENAREQASKARSVRSAQACSAALRTVAKAGVIRFDFASHDLSAESFSTLKAVAAQAKACTSFSIRVSGHTDSIGAKSRNMALSRRRAQSVVDYLVGAGIARSRLEAVGFGEKKPVVPNTTRANMARNRRIEFDAK